MTWKVVSDEEALHLKEEKGKHLLLFYASGEPPWCPDCQDVDPVLKKVFDNQESKTLNVIKVGQRDEWKSPSNKWRFEPYKVNEIPTLIVLEDGKETQRLLKDDLESEENVRKLLD